MFTKYGEHIPRCIAESEAVDLKKQNVFLVRCAILYIAVKSFVDAC